MTEGGYGNFGAFGLAKRSQMRVLTFVRHASYPKTGPEYHFRNDDSSANRSSLAYCPRSLGRCNAAPKTLGILF